MPFALVFIGLVLIVTGAKGTHAALGRQISSDFTGEGNFFHWFLAIGFLGILGSIKEFRDFSRIFMTLILVSMILSNEGFFTKLLSSIKTGPVPPESEIEEENESAAPPPLKIIPGGPVDRARENFKNTVKFLGRFFSLPF